MNKSLILQVACAVLVSYSSDIFAQPSTQVKVARDNQVVIDDLGLDNSFSVLFLHLPQNAHVFANNVIIGGGKSGLHRSFKVSNTTAQGTELEITVKLISPDGSNLENKVSKKVTLFPGRVSRLHFFNKEFYPEVPFINAGIKSEKKLESSSREALQSSNTGKLSAPTRELKESVNYISILEWPSVHSIVESNGINAQFDFGVKNSFYRGEVSQVRNTFSFDDKRPLSLFIYEERPERFDGADLFLQCKTLRYSAGRPVEVVRTDRLPADFFRSIRIDPRTSEVLLTNEVKPVSGQKFVVNTPRSTLKDRLEVSIRQIARNGIGHKDSYDSLLHNNQFQVVLEIGGWIIYDNKGSFERHKIQTPLRILVNKEMLTDVVKND